MFIIVDKVFENLASGIFKNFKKLNKFTVDKIWMSMFDE